MKSNYKNNLQLIGKNQEDLQIISTYLQDSIVTVKDMVFLKKNRTFIIIVNRFMWEDLEKDVFKKNKRTRCAIRFEEVLGVKSKNINQKNNEKNLECLAIESHLVNEQGYEINIFFAGDSIITIIVEAIEVLMRDIGKPWIVKHAPMHRI